MKMYEHLIERAERPSFKGNLENAVVSEDKNQLCGDHVKVYLKIENNRIVDARFEGSGCIISMASSDLLLENIIGKNIEEVLKLDRDFVIDLIGINLGINRIKCAMLPLKVIKNAIIKYLSDRNDSIQR